MTCFPDYKNNTTNDVKNMAELKIFIQWINTWINNTSEKNTLEAIYITEDDEEKKKMERN